jgi:predicted amidohydrolase
VEDAGQGARDREPGRLFGCNCTGRRAGRPYVGASVAYDAWGDCPGELDEHPGVLRCDIDVDAVRAARSDFCQLADRILALPQPNPVSQ